MGLLEQIREDVQTITGNADEFGVSITITNPAGTETATINGLHTSHHQQTDTMGLPVHGKNAHCSFSEALLTAEGYTVRNSNGEVSLHKHRVAVKDSTGILKNYVIEEADPDETFGLIRCILGDYKAS